jgi:ornithine cyclodeaminase
MTGPVAIGAVTIGPGEGWDRLKQVIDALADAFGDLSAGSGSGLLRSPSRTIIEHGGERQLLVGPAVWERRGVGSVKITTLTPGNPRRGLPLIHGIVVLTDLETGRITALLDGGELTAIRTGAVAGLATMLCAPSGAEDLAVVGAGVQAHALVRAVSAVRPIRSVRVFSRDRGRAEEFADRVRETAGHRVTVCHTARAAVTDAPVICTATSTSDQTPLVAADWVARGAHVNAIGGTHEDAIEVEPALLAAAFVLVEQRSAALRDAGEVRAALGAGLIGVDQLHELGALVNGDVTADGRTTVFRSVGMAIEDTAAAAALYEAALA